MGISIGARVGLKVGSRVGIGEGVCVGTNVGPRVGPVVGITVGIKVGTTDGSTDGVAEGTEVGLTDGTMVGKTVVIKLGITVGAFVGVMLGVMVGKTRGSGTLRYDSADPFARPLVESRLGEHPDDGAKLREGLRLAWQLANSPAIRDVATPAWPRTELLDRSDDDWLLQGTGSGYHPCGTAPMGHVDDKHAVVDFHGRVHGVEGLLVADASIMPTVPSTNINLPTIMIGERFGEWLREGVL